MERGQRLAAGSGRGRAPAVRGIKRGCGDKARSVIETGDKERLLVAIRRGW